MGKKKLLEYLPDKWLVVKITGNDLPPVYKVFACWYGDYLGSDSWKLNSGITKVTETNEYFFFEGSSGSTYKCRKGMYGYTSYGASILNDMIDRAAEKDVAIKVLPDETNFMEIDYE